MLFCRASLDVSCGSSALGGVRRSPRDAPRGQAVKACIVRSEFTSGMVSVFSSPPGIAISR